MFCSILIKWVVGLICLKDLCSPESTYPHTAKKWYLFSMSKSMTNNTIHQLSNEKSIDECFAFEPPGYSRRWIEDADESTEEWKTQCDQMATLFFHISLKL